VEFWNKVSERFLDELEKMAALYACYNHALTSCLSKPPKEGPREAWEKTHDEAKSVLEGHQDLLEEFEMCCQQIQDAWPRV